MANIYGSSVFAEKLLDSTELKPNIIHDSQRVCVGEWKNIKEEQSGVS